jgi:anti-sigma regulatory factor (Ser/Thr protein kinase)
MDAGETLEDPPGERGTSTGLLSEGTWTCTPTHDARIELHGGLQAPQEARRVLEQHFGAVLDTDALASVELLTTELVSNAVRHGGGGESGAVLLHLAVAADRVRVEVSDTGTGFEPGPPTPYGEGGYGLFLVDEVSSRWGVTQTRGTCAWFELDISGGETT